ncbi:GSCOCG00010260001-RA-CDS, partial [Cotesia congregata]
ITKKFLKERPELIVARADKGNTTVVMFKDEYDREMRKMLDDRETYKLLNKDPINKWQKVANDLVKELIRLEIGDEHQGKHLKANYTVAPRIYGLRKTHKQTCSLRPVVSCVNSPSYNLAKFLHKILSPVIETFQYNIKNSFDFVAFSKTVSLPEGYVLISLDVVSLFTNVLIEETWDNIKHLVGVPRNVLEDLIGFCYDSSYFVYQGEFYSQIEGSSMGNPASPVIANIVMNYVIGQILMLLPFDVHFLKLYVDDTIAAIPEEEVNNILGLFNSLDNNIQFTMEVEKDNSLSFLDVLVKRSDGKLITDWFIKPISSGRLFNWKSNHPRSQKIGMIKGLLDRMTRLSSSDFYEVNFEKIRIMLFKNNYDLSLVDSVINRFKEKCY